MVVLCAALGALSACGGGKPAAQGDQRRPAAQRPAQASAIGYLRKAESSTEQAQSATVEGTTTSRQGERQMYGTLEWADGGQGDLAVSGTSPNPLLAAATEFRLTRDAMYLRVSDAYAAKFGGRHWLQYDLSLLAQQGPSQASLVSLLRTADPTQDVKLLIAGGDVRMVGRESVRGVITTHYSGTVRASELTGRLRTEMDAERASSEQLDLWVGSDNLLVKKAVVANTATGEVSSTDYYSNYRKAAGVSAPPSRDTLDLAALLRRHQGTTTTA